MTGTVVTWLTQDAHDRLKQELDDLVAHRPVIAAEINARREEGDLKENGGYHAARDEQAKQEARIRHLQEILASAQVGVPPADDGVVEPGMVVTIEPGIYFIPTLLAKLKATPHAKAVNWSNVEHLLPFGGVRIEDEVHCTDGAPENLTRDAFAALA